MLNTKIYKTENVSRYLSGLSGRKLIYIITFFALANELPAQNIYITNDGHVLITSLYQKENILIESHKLKLFLNYKTKDFTGTLDIRTLQTGVDSLDSINKTKPPFIVQFTGNIPDDDFITWNHPKLKMKVPVKVMINKIEKEIIMNATLEHFKASRNYVCSLTGSFDMNISQFNVKAEAFADSIKVQFLQLLLRRQEQ